MNTNKQLDKLLSCSNCGSRSISEVLSARLGVNYCSDCKTYFKSFKKDKFTENTIYCSSSFRDKIFFTVFAIAWPLLCGLALWEYGAKHSWEIWGLVMLAGLAGGLVGLFGSWYRIRMTADANGVWFHRGIGGIGYNSFWQRGELKNIRFVKAGQSVAYGAANNRTLSMRVVMQLNSYFWRSENFYLPSCHNNTVKGWLIEKLTPTAGVVSAHHRNRYKQFCLIIEIFIISTP